jgi:Polyketide cyclase / dehydrase and lipid transport
MGSVEASVTVDATVHDAEQLWYDTGAWDGWVDGLEHVLAVEPSWPAVGSSVSWESGPAGRGHVTERVVAYAPLEGQSLDVTDDTIEGRQGVAFTPVGGGTEVALSLKYRIRKRSIFTPLIDMLFVRNAWNTSLRSTLARFAAELDQKAVK